MCAAVTCCVKGYELTGSQKVLKILRDWELTVYYCIIHREATVGGAHAHFIQGTTPWTVEDEMESQMPSQCETHRFFSLAESIYNMLNRKKNASNGRKHGLFLSRMCTLKLRPFLTTIIIGERRYGGKNVSSFEIFDSLCDNHKRVMKFQCWHPNMYIFLWKWVEWNISNTGGSAHVWQDNMGWMFAAFTCCVRGYELTGFSDTFSDTQPISQVIFTPQNGYRKRSSLHMIRLEWAHSSKHSSTQSKLILSINVLCTNPYRDALYISFNIV